jgi:hypothetical protein
VSIPKAPRREQFLNSNLSSAQEYDEAYELLLQLGIRPSDVILTGITRTPRGRVVVRTLVRDHEGKPVYHAPSQTWTTKATEYLIPEGHPWR